MIRHPNLIQLYEIIETDAKLYLIMEYAQGGELFNYIVERKKLWEKSAVKFYRQILNGIEYMGKVKVSHR